jgi:hypothetical protein
MLRRIMLSVFALAVTAVTASAADLSTQSRLGAIFAEPSDARARADRSHEKSPQIMPFNLLPDPPWNRGGAYYGSSWSYSGGPYYGSPFTLGGRLPYVCGLYGYC